MRGGLEGEAPKVITLEQICGVEDPISEALESDAREAVALAVEVTTNVQEYGVEGGGFG